MSDEYHNSGGFKGSLVNESVSDTIPGSEGNYPPPGDTTSEGGYGGDVNSSRTQRGLVDSSLDSGQFGKSVTPQGNDKISGSVGEVSREDNGITKTGDSRKDGPLSGSTVSGYQDRRSEGYESAAAGIVDSTDIGA